MLPVQVHMSYFNLDSLVYLFIVLRFFSGVAFGHVRIYMMYI